MDNLSSKYNRILISIFSIAPFAAYVTITYMHISFNRVLQFLSFFGVILIILFRNNKFPLKFPRYLTFYLLFIIFVFYSDLIRLEREFKIEYLFSNKLIGTFNMMLIIENIYISKLYYRNLLKVSKAVLIIAISVIIIQQVYDPTFFMRPTMEDQENFIEYNDNTVRLYSIYSWFGTILSAGFSFVPIFFIVFEDLDRRNKKIAHWILIGIIFAFLSKQRWLMLNFSLLILLIHLNSNYKNRIKRFFKVLFSIPIVIGGLIFILSFLGINTFQIFQERIFESHKKELNETSAGTRILAFKAFNKFYWDNPITGVGNIKYGMGGTGEQNYELRRFLNRRSSQIHVGYLSLFYMYGLIGGLLFLSFLYCLLKKLFLNAKKTKIWAPFLGILGVAINNFVDVNFQLFIMGLIIALVTDSYYSQQQEIYGNIENS